MFFKQIKKRRDNFSYIIADDVTRKAAVVDPSFNADAIIRISEDQKLDIEYVINTHHHKDHTADNERIKSFFGAKVVAHKLSRIDKDIGVVDDEVGCSRLLLLAGFGQVVLEQVCHIGCSIGRFEIGVRRVEELHQFVVHIGR